MELALRQVGCAEESSRGKLFTTWKKQRGCAPFEVMPLWPASSNQAPPPNSTFRYGFISELIKWVQHSMIQLPLKAPPPNTWEGEPRRTFNDTNSPRRHTCHGFAPTGLDLNHNRHLSHHSCHILKQFLKSTSMNIYTRCDQKYSEGCCQVSSNGQAGL